MKLPDNTSVQSSVYDCAGQRVQTTEGSIVRTLVYDILGQNVADYLGSSGSTLERENIYRGGQLLATNESLSAGAPSALAATPSSSNVALSWTAGSGASKYRVERKGAGGSYGLLTTTTSTSTTDSGASSRSAYLYRVCAADAANNCTSDYSNIALGAPLHFTTDATIVSYAENPATATEIKAAHIMELRTAINAVRSLAGQSAGTWTHSGLAAGDYIYADDVRDLRSQLNDALVALGIVTSSYTDNTITSYADDPLTATVFKAVHIRELRTRSTSGAGNSTSGGSSGGLHYVLSDLQGTARAVMNNNGSSSAVVARHDYLPFGEEIGSGLGLRSSTPGYAASDTNRWKYGMLQRDAATGLDHTWWRKYESASGRWTSPDPLRGNVGNPQSLNGYTYVGSDPVSFIDPLGVFRLATRPPSSLFGDYFLSASQGGHGPMVIGLIDDHGEPQNPPGGGIRAPLTGERKNHYDASKEKAKHLSDSCKKFLSGQGFSNQQIANLGSTIDNIRAYDGLTSTLGLYDAGLSDKPEENLVNVQEHFLNSDLNPDPNNFAATAHFARSAAGATSKDVYFGLNGLTPLTILHEALHIQTGLDDDALARKLGVTTIPKGSDSSEEISNILHANGCF